MADLEITWGAKGAEPSQKEQGSTFDCFQMISCDVRLQINAIPLVVLLYRTPAPDQAANDLARSKMHADVLIELGGTTLLQGTVQQQQLTLTHSHANLQITVVHPMQALRCSVKSAVHGFASGPISGNQVVQNILSGYGSGWTDYHVSGLNTQHEQLVQHGVTDWAFICRQMALDGAWLIPTATGLNISVPVAAGGASRTHKLEGIGGKCLLQEGQWSRDIEHFTWAGVSAWDIDQQRMSESVKGNRASLGSGFFDNARLGSFSGRGIEVRHAKAVLGASSRAEGLKLERELASLRASFRLKGVNHVLNLRVGHAVELTEFAEPLNGKAIITGLHHRLQDDAWTTELSVGQPLALLDASSEVASPSTLLIGKVDSYPVLADSLGRVRVTIPAIDPDTALWARLATPLAGNRTGLCLYPGEGDEVLLQFVEGDLSQPVIVGSVHNPLHPAPFRADTQGITRSGVVFDRDLYLIFDRQRGEVELVAERSIDLLALNAVSLEASRVQLNGAQKIELSAKAMALQADTTLDLEGNAVGIVGQSVDFSNTAGAFDTQAEDS